MTIEIGRPFVVRKSILIYLAVGAVIAAGTVLLGWWFVDSGFITSARWQVVAMIMLVVELVFLLFIPANKGGQQFGPHGPPASSPLVSSGADFHDAHPSRRLRDIRWLLIGVPVLVAGIGLVVTL